MPGPKHTFRVGMGIVGLGSGDGLAQHVEAKVYSTNSRGVVNTRAGLVGAEGSRF